MRIALGIEYCGSDFHGWQKQVGLRTVQDELQKALSCVANHPVEVSCAGRTDAGVHAMAQVVHFDSDAKRLCHHWCLGANANLPSDIAVKWACVVDRTFHARLSALRRRYCYLIYNYHNRLAINAKQITWHIHSLDENLMQQAGQLLLGEHDFSSFRASACQAKSPIRTLYHLTIKRYDNIVVLEVVANSFLHHMVRNIAGVLMAIGAGRQKTTWAYEVLQAKNRKASGVTAPPDGLYLMEIIYPLDFNLPTYSSNAVPFIMVNGS